MLWVTTSLTDASCDDTSCVNVSRRAIDPMKNQISWSRVIVEGAVIVASILLAFAIDTWWDNRDRAAQLAEDLRSVAKEMETNRDLLALDVTRLRRYISGTESLLQLLDAHPDAPTVLVQDTMAFYAMAWHTMDPSLGAVDALLASGRLSAIRNPRLRVLIAGLRDQFRDAMEEERLSRELHYSTFLPQVRETLDIRFAWRIAFQFWIVQGGEGSYIAEELIAFPNSLGIRNSIRERSGLYTIGANEMSQLQMQLEEMLTLLDDAISDR